MKPISIATRQIGDSHPCFLIAEVSQSHDGSLGMAHAFIDAAAEAGADAVKFQTHIAAAESTLDEPFRIKFSRQDESRYAYWKRMEFSEEQWAGVAEHAKAKSLIFLSSPFSIAAVELLKRVGMPAWKVGSGEVQSKELLDAMLDAGGPILLSTGMSRWDEIDRAVTYLRGRNADFALFQCTSKYPTPLQEVGINLIEELRRRYDCLVGLSDHSATPFPALAAIARGCHIVELHVTFDRRLFGPDVPASVTFEELALIKKARDSFAVMDQSPVDKDAMADQLAAMRRTFGKSIAPARALPAGTELTRDMLTLKKPATGIPGTELDNLIGKRLRSDVMPDRLLTWKDLIS